MDIRWAPGFSLSQAMDMLNDDDDETVQQVDEIFITPPEANKDTDEDSGDDNEGGTVYNLTGRQLRAEAEIKLINNNRIGEVNYSVETLEDCAEGGSVAPRQEVMESTLTTAASTIPQMPGPSSSNPINIIEWITNRFKDHNDPEWIDGDLEPPQRLFPPTDYTQYKEMSCVDIFEMFFDDQILHYLCEETQRYSQYKNETDPKISVSELRCFIGILILTGYNHLPSKRMYWDMKDDVHNRLVANAMRRNRFLAIQKYIHMADNTKINRNDRAWKLRPLMEKVKQKCLQHFQPVRNLSYDESMVKYYGRHGCKQFIRGKPIRFGYKMWSLNTNEGYLINFDLYQGKDPRGVESVNNLFGKAAAPLVLMLEELPKLSYPYVFHMDNLFTGFNLLSYLRDKGYGAIGTIRENRIPRSCPITDKNRFKKKKRGDYEHIIERNNGILLIRWMDNSVVTVASTYDGVQPVGTVRRYSQKHKRRIMVDRPKCISSYNDNMGGTDLMDQGIANYRIGIRGKKWYWSIFTWIIDAALQNAWFLCTQNRDISNLDFRREIVQTYLTKYGVAPKGPGRISLTRNILPDIKFDRTDHFVASCNRRRCAGAGCKSFGRTMCQKCNVGLCINCFATYHTK